MKQNNYQQTRRQISKQLAQLDPKSFQNQNEEAANNLRIDTFMKTISKLETEISYTQQQIQYCQTASQWIQQCINASKPKPPTNNLKSLMNSSAKLNVLERQAIMFKNIKPTPSINKENVNNTNKCNISAHLRYILTQKNDRKAKIKALQAQKKSLYDKIKQNLMKQQPYLYEKILKKIQKQVKRQLKLQAIIQIHTTCKQKQQWLTQTKSQINQKVDQKLIQQKIANNLQKMKQIMNKKINNNEYILTVTNNKGIIEKNIQKLNKSVNEIKVKIKQQMEKMNKISLQNQLEQIENEKISKEKIIQIDNIFIEEINGLLKEGHKVLRQPLGSHEGQYLLVESERLNTQLNIASKKII